MKPLEKKLQMSALFLKRKKYVNQGERMKKAKVIKGKKKRLKWTNEETRRYCKFIENNELILGKKQKKQKQRIYNKMATFIRTRNSRQCKSHHQKLLKKYENVATIVHNLLTEIKKDESQNFIQMKIKEKPDVEVQETNSPKNNSTIHDYSLEIQMSYSSNQCCQDCFLNSLISEGFLTCDERCVHKQFLS